MILRNGTGRGTRAGAIAIGLILYVTVSVAGAQPVAVPLPVLRLRRHPRVPAVGGGHVHRRRGRPGRDADEQRHHRGLQQGRAGQRRGPGDHQALRPGRPPARQLRLEQQGADLARAGSVQHRAIAPDFVLPPTGGSRACPQEDPRAVLPGAAGARPAAQPRGTTRGPSSTTSTSTSGARPASRTRASAPSSASASPTVSRTPSSTPTTSGSAARASCQGGRWTASGSAGRARR